MTSVFCLILYFTKHIIIDRPYTGYFPQQPPKKNESFTTVSVIEKPK